MKILRRNRVALAGTLALCLAAAAAASAQVPQPRIYSTSPTGAQAGTSVEMKITGGADLDDIRRLVFSHPGITFKPVMSKPDRFYPDARPVANTFTVTVAKDVPPGIYEIRAAGSFGISNARRFVVTDRKQVMEKEDNNTSAKATEIAVETDVCAVADDRNYDYYTFTAKKGQRYIVTCDAHRLDSRAIMAMSVLDEAGFRAVRSVGTKYGDPVLDFTAEKDGPVVLEFHNLIFKGGDSYYYRFAVTTRPWVDFAEPAALKAGADTKVTLYGRNLPGGAPAKDVLVDGRPLEKLEVTVKAPAETARAGVSSEIVFHPSQASGDFFSWRLSSKAGKSNPVRFLLSDATAVRETEPNDESAKAQKVKLPAEVAGRFQKANDLDWTEFEAKKGQKLWIEVFSQRLGLSTDPLLVIQQVTKDKEGKETLKDLKDVDDAGDPMPTMQGNRQRMYRMGGKDPSILWTAPADGTFRVLVRDLYSSAQGDARLLYRLVIREPKPDFRLVGFPVEAFPANNQSKPVATVLRSGGASRINVVAFRREGFDKAIRVEASSLPKGVTVSPVVIGSYGNYAELVVRAAPDAPAFAGSIALVGRAEVGDRKLERSVRAAETLWQYGRREDKFAVLLRSGFGLSVDGDFKAPFTAELGEKGKVYRMARAGKLEIPVKLVKQADFKDIAKAKIKLSASGLPGGRQKTITGKDVTLEVGKPDGKMEIAFTDKAPVGTFTFYVQGEVTVPYKHDPGGRVKRTADDKKRIEGLEKKIGEEAKQAAAALKKADQDEKAAQQALAKAKDELKKAEAAAKGKANEAVGKAKDALKAAEEKAKAAQEAKGKATEADKQAKDLVKKAAAEKKKTADLAKKAADGSKEKKLKVLVASLPVTVEVAAYPITLTFGSKQVSVSAGGKADVAAQLKREFGFADEVKLQVRPPSGVKVTLDGEAKFAKGKGDAKVVLKADKGQKPGVYTVTVRTQIKFGGKNFTLDRPLEVKVEPAAGQ